MPEEEAAALRARLEVIEELLEIYERTVIEQTSRIETQAEELRRSNQALEQFAYVISHDLQEPLRTISAYTEMLGDRYRGQLDPKADKYIDFAVSAAKRMQQMINALLDYSRITARGKDFAMVPLDAAVDDALRNLAAAVEESHAEIVRERLGVVYGDRVQIAQLAQNLIGNALKFRRPDAPPRIRIWSMREGAHEKLSISDNGLGIDPRYHERIFVVFQRLSPKHYAGTGIGLSICQRIAERHGGKIWVESALGSGSTFHVTLCAEQEKP